MARIIILLLISTAFYYSALSLDREVAASLANTLCQLAYGANESNELIKVLNTECKPDCDFDRKVVTFVCKKIPQCNFCDEVRTEFGNIIANIDCSLRCDDEKSTVSIKCRSIKYY